MLIIPMNEYHAIMRQDFCGFIERSFYELNPETEFLPNWHIEELAAELEACRRGETKGLIVNLPPRSLKSHCATVGHSQRGFWATIRQRKSFVPRTVRIWPINTRWTAGQ